MPDVQTIDLIKEMKLRLSTEIGWFSSKNALAHFTIFECLDNEQNEPQLFKILERVAAHIQPFEIACDAFNSYDNGAFYIQPNSISTDVMANEMKYILKETNGIKKSITNTTPHLTIGRQLNEKQLKVAKEMFQEINIHFPVTHLTLRKFNEEKKQFDLYQHFPLLGKPKEIQGGLF